MEQEQELKPSVNTGAENQSKAQSREKNGASSTKRGDGFYFAGFQSPNYTPIPDEFFDLIAPQLSEAELRVLLYIMRRTFGFKKHSDAISLNQLTGGIRRRNGEIQDKGTGLSKPAALKGAAGLKDKGIIAVDKATAEDGRNEINVYRLRYAGEGNEKTSNSNKIVENAYSKTEYSTIEKPKAFNSKPGSLYTPVPVSAHTLIEVHTDPALPGLDPPLNCKPQNNNNPVKIIQKGTLSNTEKPERAGGNKVYPGSKSALLPDFTAACEADNSKASLPLPTYKNNRSKDNLLPVVNSTLGEGKSEEAEWVKQINLQHASLQKNRNQDTASNKFTGATLKTNLAVKLGDDVVVDMVENNNNLLEQNLVNQSLQKFGLSSKSATELVENWPLQYLKQKIRLVEQLRQRNPSAIKNLPGFVRQAINENYQPTIQSSNLDRKPSSRFRKVNSPAQPYVQSYNGSSVGDYTFKDLDYSPEVYKVSDFVEISTSERTVPENYPDDFASPQTPVKSVLEEKGNWDATETLVEKKGEFYTSAECKTLWEKVCLAVSDRFRRADLAAKLTPAKLVLKKDSKQALIYLPWPLVAHSFLSSEKALLQMAFSQVLGSGYKLNFEEI